MRNFIAIFKIIIIIGKIVSLKAAFTELLLRFYKDDAYNNRLEISLS